MLTESDLKDVLAEIAEWPLAERRAYIEAMAQQFGESAAQQIRDGLAAIWKAKGK